MEWSGLECTWDFWHTFQQGSVTVAVDGSLLLQPSGLGEFFCPSDRHTHTHARADMNTQRCVKPDQHTHILQKHAHTLLPTIKGIWTQFCVWVCTHTHTHTVKGINWSETKIRVKVTGVLVGEGELVLWGSGKPAALTFCPNVCNLEATSRHTYSLYYWCVHAEISGGAQVTQTSPEGPMAWTRKCEVTCVWRQHHLRS